MIHFELLIVIHFPDHPTVRMMQDLSALNPYPTLQTQSKNYMQKARKDKTKKNAETIPLVATQNTNLFSQLSAQYLQTKAVVSEEEKKFIDNTEVIEYHDPEINRILQRLRKRDETTKIKAILQLREQILKMEEQDVTNFSITFSYLFRALVLNEESKKVQIELQFILQHLLKNFKKALLPNIAILFPALLIFQKVNRCNLFNLLFTGEESTHLDKALILIEKPEVAKQFLILAKIIIDKHDKEKLGQSLLLNNCSGLLKAFKELVQLKAQKQQIDEWSEQWNHLYNEMKEVLVSPGASEFLKENTKAKAAILDIDVVFVEIAARSKKTLDKIEEQMLKRNRVNFLEKDQVIQNSLWKHCNTKLLEILLLLNRPKEIEEIESKFLGVLDIGGEFMYKELRGFIQLLPSYKLNTSDPTLFLNTLALIKKTNQTLLNSQQFNEQRLQSYQDINLYFLTLYHKAQPLLQQVKGDEKERKRWEECKKALQKAERAVVQNLQELYYKYPPASKNSFTYYIPPVFCSLIKQIQVLPRSNISIPLTYHLYKEISSDKKFQPLVDEIFNSRSTLDQLLEYFQHFPSRPVEVDMTGDNVNQIYKKCRIYQLTIQDQRPDWFKWGRDFNFFMFDSMLEVKHISQIDNNEQIKFNKGLNIEKMEKYLPEKLRHVQNLMRELSPELKYYIPSYLRYISKSEGYNINTLIDICAENRSKLTVPNTSIIKTVLHIYSIIIQYLKTHKQPIPNIQLDLFSFILYLYDFNMESEAYSLLEKTFELRDTVYFKSVLEGLSGDISKRIQGYVDSGEIVEEKKEKILKKKVEKFIVILNRTLQLLVKINHRPRELVRGFLKESYFKYGLYRPEIWILFHSMAVHLTSSEIEQTIKELISEQNYYMLGLLICVNSIYPLQTHLELKKFYQTIYTTEISPRIIDLFQNDDPKGYALITKMLELCDRSLIFSIGIKNLLKQSIVEDIPESQIQKLFDITILSLFNTLGSKDENAMRKSITIQTILPEFSSLMPKNMSIFEKSLQTVQAIAKQTSPETTQFQVHLDIVTIFWQQKINTDLIFQLDIDSIIKYLFSSLHKHITNINFEIQVLLNFMNVVIENKTLEPFSDYLLDIERYVGILMEHNKEKSPEFMNNALIKLCQFLRKILPIIEAFSPEFKDGLFTRVLDLCILKVKEFEKVAEDIDSGVVDQNIDTIIMEFSELINRFTLVPSIKGKEEDILQLLSTRFSSLQKSSFLYLRHYYQTGNNTKDSILYLMKKALTGEATNDISTVFSETLLWTLLFIRKTNFNPGNEDLEEFELIFEREECSYHYLDFVFKMIEHLGYDETEEEFYCDVDQVTEVALDWSNYMTERELFKLFIQSLFVFSSSFPMDLRLWYDRQKDKKQQSLCQKILKNIISDALFSKQIEKIELRQLEWKSEEFDVYALKKSKEICAEYANNGAKISLKLKIKDNYPLSPILIEFGNQLKIQQKLNKWILKLKSLLYNQNNSICSGIILWKQNIDKQFEGLDECAICYDIVNGQKQLPSMVCKTCKKKFHSACIRKWFQTSNKSQCPLCKSQFL